MRRSNSNREHHGESGRVCPGFSLVELLVAIGIIAILLGILLPTARKVRESAHTTRCLANLREIGFAISRYADDHHGFVVPGDHISLIDGASQPGGGSWADILVDGRYITCSTGDYSTTDLVADFPEDMERVSTILRCPSGMDENASEDYPTSQTDVRGSFYFVRGSDTTHKAVFTWYAINAMPRESDHDYTADEKRPRPFAFLPDYGSGRADWTLNRLSKLKPLVPMVFDGVWCFNGDPARINARHNGRRYTNILFADGHCSTELTSSLPNSNWYLR